MVPEMIISSSAVTVISTHIALHSLCHFYFFLLKFWYLYHKTVLILIKTVKILFFISSNSLFLCIHVPMFLRPACCHHQLIPICFCAFLLLITAVSSCVYANYTHIYNFYEQFWFMKIIIENICIFMLRYKQHIIIITSYNLAFNF